jgi:hypothetical protein
MGVRRRKGAEEFQIPDEIARDTEVSQAVADHMAAADPHGQYLLERTLPLLSHGLLGATAGIPNASSAPFNANTWNPNAGQAHQSAVNIAAVGMGGASGNANLPNGSSPGLIVELDPFLNTPWAGVGKTQFFAYFSSNLSFLPSLYMRQSILGTFSWHPWQQITVNGESPQLRVGTGAPLKRLISKTFTIDPASISVESVQGFEFSVAGAIPGDTVFITPIGGDLWNTAIWPFEFVGYCNGTDSIVLLLRNEWTAPLDLAPFQVRVVVMGF